MSMDIEQRPSKYRFVIGSMVCANLMVSMFSYTLVSPLVTVISQDTGIEIALVGYLATAFMLSVGVSVMGATFVLEKLGVRASMVLAMCLSAAGGIGIIWADSLAALLVCRIMAGVGLGMVGAGFSAVSVEWFPQRERPAYVTVYTLSSSIVSAVCFTVAFPLYELLNNDWRMEFAVLGAASALMAIVWAMLGRDHPQSSAVALVSVRRRARGGLRDALQRRDVRMIVYASTAATVGETVIITYMPSFLETVKGYDAVSASRYAGLISVVSIAGTVASGAVSSILGKRRPVFILGMFFTTLSTVILLTAKNKSTLLAGIVLFGFMYRYKLPALQTTVTEVPQVTPSIAAGGYALMFGTGYVLGILTPPVVSAATRAFGMESAMLLFAGIMGIGSVCSLFIDETGPKASDYR